MKDDSSNEQTTSITPMARAHLHPTDFFTAIFPLCRSFLFQAAFLRLYLLLLSDENL
jgi:hypothetical protein